MKDRIIHLLGWILLILGTPTSLPANNHYNFTQIGLYQNMPSRVYYIYEESNGLIWLGTPEGLLQYDGNHLKSYTVDLERETAATPLTILQIDEDETHQLWVLTNQGLFRYSSQHDRFVPHLWNRRPVRAGAMCKVKGGLIFSGADTLYRYSYEHDQITSYEKLSTKDFFIRQMNLWDDSTLICSNRGNRLLLYDIKQRKESPLRLNWIHKALDFCVAPNGNLWIADYNEGLREIDRDGRTVSHYTIENSDLNCNLIRCITIIDGKIWAGTDGGGINIIDPASGDVQTLTHESGNLHSLPVNTILYIHGSQKTRSVWVSTARRGLINIRNTHMQTYQSVPLGSHLGLSEKTVISLYEEPGKDIVWIGTDGGGVNRLDTKRHTFQHYPNTWGDKVVSICNYSPRELLVSIFSQGLFLFDKATGQKTPCPSQSEALKRFIRYSGVPANLYNETDNTILVLAQPLFRYHIREKRLEEITKIPGHGIIGMICPIGSDGEYTYFYDTQSIYKMKKGGSELVSVYHSEEPSFVNAVYRNREGDFWIAGKQGLYVLREGKLTFINSPLLHKAFAVVCDETGRVWIGTGQELLSYDPQEKKFILYGEADGALKNEYLSKPILLTGNGEIYMGGVNGLLCIDSHADESLPSEKDELPVIVTDLQVGENNCMSQLDDGKLVLPWDSRNIRISFLVSGDDILRPRLFRYSLEESSRNAITSSNGELTIPSLAAGTYPIYVNYTRKDGNWSQRQRAMTLVILPPWYKSWWFNTLLIVFFGCILYFVILFLLKRKEERMKWMLTEQEHKVNEEKVHFLINISHELRTPLTLIYAPLKKIISSIRPDDPNYRPLNTAFRQSQRMKDLINMVLDVRKMEVGMSKPDMQNHPLNSWLEDVCSDFTDENGNADIIECKLDPQIGEVRFDTDKCWTILSNLLVNALKHNPKDKKITVRSEMSADRRYVRISVTDHGPGLKDIDSDKLFTRFYQGNNEQGGTGIGLSYAKILVELHHGQIGACNNPEGGATFYFELPTVQPKSEPAANTQPSYLNELLSSLSENDIDIPDNKDFTHVNPKEYTVLVVDDNEELVDYMAEELGKRFKRVLTAYDGQTAYQIVCDENPDILVSDVMMPGMNGYELCKAIKENISISHIPVILLTARNDDESRKYGYMLGADSYLEKPFEMEQLVEKILNKLYNRLQIQKHYHQMGLQPIAIENELSKADALFMEKLHQTIIDHLDNPQLDIPYLCNLIGISRASLYNKLKAIADMGANDYINKIRIERAMQLIKETNLNFTEISEKVGFASPRYFSTVFKQYTGKTPTQFKKE